MTLSDIHCYIKQIQKKQRKTPDGKQTVKHTSSFHIGGRFVYKWYVSVGEFHGLARELNKTVSTEETRLFFVVEEHAIEIEVANAELFFAFH